MVTYKLFNNENLTESLNSGEVGLLPTDTIYGLSCSAYNKDSVERIYDIKGREKHSPLIVLISDISDLKKFRIQLNKKVEQMLTANWPGTISFILPASAGFDFLTHDAKGLAFRVPDDRGLLLLLQKTGPLVSTSANPSGQPPARNISEAKDYFGDKLDFYVDAGELVSEPSTLVDLTGKRPVVLRQGLKPFRAG